MAYSLTNKKQDIERIVQEKYYGDTTVQSLACDIRSYHKGVPLAYIIGFVPFLGCRIDVSYRPLIPRPETEYWTLQLIQTLPVASTATVLDMFSGSGCIGVAIALHRPLTTVHCVDNAQYAIQQIQKNIGMNGVMQQAHTLQSDMFSNVSHTEYDVIVANPPYVARYTQGLRYEPYTALYANDKGFSYIKHTLRNGWHYLAQKGTLIIEHDPHHTKRIHTTGAHLPYTDIQTHNDQYGVKRYTVLRA